VVLRDHREIEAVQLTLELRHTPPFREWPRPRLVTAGIRPDRAWGLYALARAERPANRTAIRHGVPVAPVIPQVRPANRP
jgi:hypothetical protein